MNAVKTQTLTYRSDVNKYCLATKFNVVMSGGIMEDVGRNRDGFFCQQILQKSRTKNNTTENIP
jgi:hypothetical protein